MRLIINLLARKRPELLTETIRLTLPNISLGSTKLVVSVDKDDPETEEAALAFGGDVTVDCRVREDTLGEKFNRVLNFEPADELYLYLVDYAAILTKGFDKRFLDAAEAFPDGIGCVYSPLASMSFPGFIAMTNGMARKIGYLAPPYFPYWFFDHWMDDMARLIGRIAYADVHIDHHSRRPPRSHGLWEPDFWATLYDLAHFKRCADAEKIIWSRGFVEPQWRRELLVRNFPLTEQRSQAINSFVRVNHAAISQARGDVTKPDERYLRAKAKALTLMQTWVTELEGFSAQRVA